jgi:membrane protein implicated in regulation of membrane protease activity
MYKAWIAFTIFSAVFFITCLIIVIFFNSPVFKNLWQEGLLLVSVLNLVIAFLWYRRRKDELTRKKWEGNNQ